MSLGAKNWRTRAHHLAMIADAGVVQGGVTALLLAYC